MLESMYEGDMSTVTTRKRIREAMNTLGPLLHPLHYSLMSARSKWIKWYSLQEDWPSALEMALDMGSAYSYSPSDLFPSHPVRADVALTISFLKLRCIEMDPNNANLKTLQSAQRSAEQALSLLEATYGPGHDAAEEVREMLAFLNASILSLPRRLW